MSIVSKADLMLTSKDIQSLMLLVSEEACRLLPLETLSKRMQQQFQKVDTYRVASALALMLSHADMLPQRPQRIAAVFLLYDMYREDHAWKNPFANVFVKLLDRHTSSADSKTQPMPPGEQHYRTLCEHFETTEFGVPCLNDAEVCFLRHLMAGCLPRDTMLMAPKQACVVQVFFP